MIGAPIPVGLPAGVILAGGRASRLGGGDKGLRMLDGAPILKRVLDRMRYWADPVLLSANGDPARLRGIDWLAGVDIIGDEEPGQPGPLAGILAAMDRVTIAVPDRQWLLCLPCDTPFLPADLANRLLSAAAANDGSIIMAAGPDGRSQPTISLWPMDLREELRTALRAEGLRKVGAFAARHGLVTVPFLPGHGGVDPFFNINAPDDLTRAETIIRSARP